MKVTHRYFLNKAVQVFRDENIQQGCKLDPDLHIHKYNFDWITFGCMRFLLIRSCPLVTVRFWLLIPPKWTYRHWLTYFVSDYILLPGSLSWPFSGSCRMHNSVSILRVVKGCVCFVWVVCYILFVVWLLVLFELSVVETDCNMNYAACGQYWNCEILLRISTLVTRYP